MGSLGAIIGWIIFGLVVGAIARLVMPGQQSIGILMTIALGIAGSFVGGCLATLLTTGVLDVTQPSGWIGSIIGAFLLLFGYGMMKKG